MPVRESEHPIFRQVLRKPDEAKNRHGSDVLRKPSLGNKFVLRKAGHLYDTARRTCKQEDESAHRR